MIYRFGNRSGMSLEVKLDGIHASGWYDGNVAIDADGFLGWEVIDNARFNLERKAKERKS